VLAGHYFFTQPLGSGVNFPYAIGLYVFAAPWSLLTHNHVALLRVVVCAMNAIAALLAYRMVVEAWADERAGAIAALLFGLVPGWFVVLGNANLTNAFGQSVAVIALSGVVLLKLDWKSAWPPAALTVVVALAFLSHVSTVALLSATLVIAAALFWWRGGKEMRTPGRVLLGVTLVAGALSVAVYYGRSEFMPVYKALALVRAPLGQHTSPISTRAAGGARQFVESIGWPIIVLAAVGAWRVRAERSRDRLAVVIVASITAGVAFSMQNTLTRVDTHLERYAAEFLARIDGATAPALVMLAARGASWSWGAGRIGRLLSIVLVAAACVAGARAWLSWF
jgi:hypothetical protein